MHDAYARIYRINVLNFEINQLICTNIMDSIQYRESQPIKCNGICIKAFNNVFPMRSMFYPLKNSSQHMHGHWKL